MWRNNLQIVNAKSDAEKRFLGQCHVVGIAVTQDSGTRLVFFLDQRSSQTEELISGWARDRGVNIDFRVTGDFRFLSRRS
jgi:hypothetical protein